MADHQGRGQEQSTTAAAPARPGAALRLILNIVIGCLLVAAGYLSSAVIPFRHASPPADTASVKSHRVIQLDVLNGCGARGASARFTTFLRSRGFDVVETKNYKTFGVPQTLVLDRTGDLTAARRVAAVLGIPASNVIQQLNPDYFVDVSVIVGEDFTRFDAAYGAAHKEKE